MLTAYVDNRGLIVVTHDGSRCGYITERQVDAAVSGDAACAYYRTERGVLDLGPRYGVYPCVGVDQLTRTEQ